MSRRRLLDPRFFTNYELWQAEQTSGLPLGKAFQGLWCEADREGRFKWEPPRLKLAILPYDVLDFAEVLTALAEAGFIVRYEVDGEVCGYIPTFLKHQKPHQREAASALPPPPKRHKGAPKASQGAPEASQGDAKVAGVVLSGVVSVSESESVAVREIQPEASLDASANGAAGPSGARAVARGGPEPLSRTLRDLAPEVGLEVPASAESASPEKAAEIEAKRLAYLARAGRASTPPAEAAHG